MKLSLLLGFLVLLIILPEVYCGKNYYDLLGIKRDATTKQIRKAYRDLSLKLHPDKNPGDKEIAAKYAEVTAAYEVLSNEEKRRVYDQYGEEGLKQGGQQQHNPFDPFNMFGGHNHQANQMRRGENIELPLEVTLEDLYLGREIVVGLRKQQLCHKCRGTGAKRAEDVKTCSVCNGKGIKVVTKQMAPGFVQQMQMTCDACNGKGTTITSTCPSCKGAKVEIGDEELTIIVEKGMVNGQQIVFSQEADELPDTTPGDLIFKIQTAPHPTMTRSGNDLNAKVWITLEEALLGFDKTFPHLDGHAVPISRKDITIPSFVEKIAGEGMPMHEFPSQKGDLYVEYHVSFPKSLTQKQREDLRKIFAELK